MANQINISAVAANVVTLAMDYQKFEKANAANAKMQRETALSKLFDAMRGETSDGDRANAVYAFRVQLNAAGWKKDSIKVKSSELGRIWDNIRFVDDDCLSWKGALKQIREATTPRQVLMQENCDKLRKAMLDAESAYAKAVAEFESEFGDYTPTASDDEDYSVEIVVCPFDGLRQAA